MWESYGILSLSLLCNEDLPEIILPDRWVYQKNQNPNKPPASRLPKKKICFTYYPQRSLEIELCRYKIKMLLKTIIFPGLHDMLKKLFYYFSLFNSFLLLFFSNQLIMWNHPLKSRNFKVKKFSVKNVSFSCSEARKEILCT